jgi:hypothetical protein
MHWTQDFWFGLLCFWTAIWNTYRMFIPRVRLHCDSNQEWHDSKWQVQPPILTIYFPKNCLIFSSHTSFILPQLFPKYLDWNYKCLLCTIWTTRKFHSNFPHFIILIQEATCTIKLLTNFILPTTKYFTPILQSKRRPFATQSKPYFCISVDVCTHDL